MNVSRFIARRYLFSKKSKSIINIISTISVIGIFVSSASMIIVLSGFNGIENLVKNIYNKHESDLVITSTEGKSFTIDTNVLNLIYNVSEIESVSKIIEEVVMIKKDERWVTASIKGVNSSYIKISTLDSSLISGTSDLWFQKIPQAIIGYGLHEKLNAHTNAKYDNNVTVYGLQRDKKLSIQNKSAFKPKIIAVGGVFDITPEINDQYLIVPIEFARELLNYQSDITAIEIGLIENINSNDIKLKLQNLLGDSYKIKTKYEKNEIMFKTNAAEKWMVFLILIFILILSTFNIIASLTMLILDKKKDISTLISLGATQNLIRKVFFKEGLYINIVGGMLGVLFGTLICLIQIKFHVIELKNSALPYWPVSVDLLDVISIMIILFFVGLISSYLPTAYLIKKHFKSHFN